MHEHGPHRSLWLDTVALPSYPALPGDLEVDVCVIGGGLTGLTAAHELKKAGLTVAVLEQGRIGHGTTGRTTAHLTQVFDTRLDALCEGFGDGAARAVWEAGRAAIAHIERLSRDDHLACDFERVPGYFFAARPDHARVVEEEAERARRLGFVADFTHERPFPPMAHGAMRVANQAMFHPGKYMAGLAARVAGDGSHVFEHAHVTRVHAGARVRAEANGFVVQARHLIYATHAPIHDPFFTTKVPAYQSYAIALRVPAGTFPHALAWDTEDPYHYWRLQPGAEHDLVIIGGEDHRTGQDDHAERRFERLAAYAADALAGVRHRVTHRWTAQWLSPVDGLPFIGRRDAGHRNEFVATGYAGNGMTFGTYAGLLITDLILGRAHAPARLFDPGRLNVRAGAVTFVSENMTFPAHLLMDRVSHPQHAEVDAIPAGQGRIVEVEGEQVAAYRDEQGGLHMCSAVCTHMACLVHFDEAQGAWACPCHGSTFGVDGEVLTGPAKRPLGQVRAKRPARS